jgi:hypothetical protein
LISTGLAAKGYVHINVDEGWLKVSTTLSDQNRNEAQR